jgi:hypothetical protein
MIDFYNLNNELLIFYMPGKKSRFKISGAPLNTHARLFILAIQYNKTHE